MGKNQHIATSLEYLDAYDKDCDSLHDRIVTVYETWVKRVNFQTKHPENQGSANKNCITNCTSQLAAFKIKHTF